MKSGALAGTPCRAELQNVAELVDEDEDHEADREREPPDPRVGRDRDEHRGGCREDLQLEDQRAVLDHEEPDPEDRREQFANGLAEPPTRVHRLVAAVAALAWRRVRERGRLGCLGGLVPRIRIRV